MELHDTQVEVKDPFVEIRRLMDEVLFDDGALALAEEFKVLQEKVRAVQLKQAEARDQIEKLFYSTIDKPKPSAGKLKKPFIVKNAAASIPYGGLPDFNADHPSPPVAYLPGEENVVISSKKGSIFFYSGGGPFVAGKWLRPPAEVVEVDS